MIDQVEVLEAGLNVQGKYCQFTSLKENPLRPVKSAAMVPL
jgi:hypothetical protein